MKILKIKWSVSKGANSYGYNIASLWEGNKKVASTNGGGYDMIGTIFGSWLKNNYLERIKKLSGNTGSGDEGGYYGLAYFDKDRKNHKNYIEDDEIYLNGACGFSAMRSIAEAIGLNVEYDSDNGIIVIQDREEGKE